MIVRCSSCDNKIIITDRFEDYCPKCKNEVYYNLQQINMVVSEREQQHKIFEFERRQLEETMAKQEAKSKNIVDTLALLIVIAIILFFVVAYTLKGIGEDRALMESIYSEMISEKEAIDRKQSALESERKSLADSLKEVQIEEHNLELRKEELDVWENELITKEHLLNGEIQLSISGSEFEGEQLAYVESMMGEYGFINIVNTPITDTDISGTARNGQVAAVSINGRYGFKAGEWYDEFVIVNIYYYDNDVQIGTAASDLCQMSHADAEEALRTAGFFNIKVVSLGDLSALDWFLNDKEGKVGSVTINGASEFYAQQWASSDSEVVIKYHSRKS